ncbi:MAG: glycosyltransferase family 39 protein [Vicinamibacterales bacterium]
MIVVGHERRPLVDVVCVVVGVAVLALVVARAVRVPLTFDEAVTYERTVAAPVAAIFDFRTATNHLLNTVLTRVSHAMFGSSVWALRLPNVIAAAGYLAALRAIARRTRHPVVAAAGVVVLATNLYALDFFALSRGYGLGLALLTLALYGLLRWIDGPPGNRWLGRAMAAAALAVAANFALLPALLAVGGVALVAAVGRGVVPTPAPPRRTLWVAVILLGAAAYSFVVFSRERVLSPDLFAPVTVRVIGLLDDELSDVFVFREEATGSFRLLPRVAPGVWRTDDQRDTWGLKIDLPHAADRNLAVVEVAVGDRVFRRTRLNEGPWQGHDWNGRRVLQSTADLALPRSRVTGIGGAINWRDDRAHWALAARLGAVTAAGLAVLWGVLALGGTVLVRRGRLAWSEYRALAWGLLAAGGVSAAPLYLLRRNEELYFGGATGLVTDSLGSLAYAASYTRGFPPGIVTALAWAMALAAVVTVAAWLVPASRQSARVPLALLGVGVLVLMGARLQHDFAGAPYPLGRTALYLWPIAGLWLWHLGDAIAGLGTGLRRVVSMAAIALAMVSAAHAATAFNLVRTFDDFADAAVPDMLRTLGDEITAQRRPPPFVHLGVEWSVLPVTRYYAARLTLPRSKILVHVVPDAEVAPDFVYVLSPGLAQGAPIRAFPIGRGTLYRLPAASVAPSP